MSNVHVQADQLLLKIGLDNQDKVKTRETNTPSHRDIGEGGREVGWQAKCCKNGGLRGNSSEWDGEGEAVVEGVFPSPRRGGRGLCSSLYVWLRCQH